MNPPVYSYIWIFVHSYMSHHIYNIHTALLGREAAFVGYEATTTAMSGTDTCDGVAAEALDAALTKHKMRHMPTTHTTVTSSTPSNSTATAAIVLDKVERNDDKDTHSMMIADSE